MILKYLCWVPNEKVIKDLLKVRSQVDFSSRKPQKQLANSTQTIQVSQTNRNWWRICLPTRQGKACSVLNLVQLLLYRSEYVGQATCETPELPLQKSTCSNSFFQQPAHPKGFSDRLLRLSSCTPTRLHVHVWASVSKFSVSHQPSILGFVLALYCLWYGGKRKWWLSKTMTEGGAVIENCSLKLGYQPQKKELPQWPSHQQ